MRNGTRYSPLVLLLSITLLALPAAAQDRSAIANAPPPWRVASVDSVPYGDILEWARSRSFETVPWFSDRQYLVTREGGVLRVGPLARIVAMTDSHLLTDESMRQGRVIGRIDSEGTAEPMGIVRGTTYVWVDDKGEGGRWRAVLFPDWTTPSQILRPTLQSFDTATAQRPYIFEAAMHVFELPGLLCGTTMTKGAFWTVEDPAGQDQVHELTSGSVGAGGCIPCDCRLCCVFNPIPRRHGLDFLGEKRPIGPEIR